MAKAANYATAMMSALLTLGPIGTSVAHVIEKANLQGISAAHYDMIFLKPIDEDILHEVGKNYKRVITVEDGSIKGVLEWPS